MKLYRIRLMICAVLVVAGVLFLLLRPVVLAERRWRSLQTHGILRIGIDPGVRPFSFYGSQGWEGMDADVAREVARRLGLRVEAVPVGYDGFYDALTAGHADVAMSALVADQARTADFRYSRPYLDAGLRAIGPASLKLDGLDDLRGRCVAVALGSDGDRLARQLERRTPGLTRRTVASEDDALAEVRAGACEVAIVGGQPAMRAGCPPLDEHGSRLPIGWHEPAGVRCLHVQPVAYVVAFARDDVRLADAFDQVLAEMLADGTLTRIVQHWLGLK